MDFKQWLENSNTSLVPTTSEDPELNGLSRKIDYIKPRLKKTSIASKKIDRLFGKKIEESKEQDYGGCSFFTDGERVLLLKRSPYAETAPNKWGLVCGHSQGDETALATARRESKEETGKKLGKRFGVLGENNKFPVYFFYVQSPFECKLDDENAEWEWVRFDDLGKYDLHPLLKRSIGKFVEYVRDEL
jgi:8-oxo-dGTP pyrophosphatase MutT (NUDIX family)